MNVIFDVGNVLLDWDARRVYRDDFASDAEIEAFFEEVGFDAWNREQDRGRSWAEAIAAARAEHPRRAALMAKYDSHWRMSLAGAIEGSVAILDRLAEAGVPLYALTNFSAEKWAGELAVWPFLRERFRDVVVSAHEGLIKPDPAIYRLLMTRNGLAPGECVFIDDSPANVEGARAVGMDAIRFTDPQALAGALRKRGLPL